MTVPQLIHRLSGVSGLPRTRTALLVRDFVSVVQEELTRGGSVTLHGLGTLRVKACSSRIIESFRGRTCVTPGRKVSFRPSRSLRSLIS